MTVFHHLPFENGTASVVTVCAPRGRYGNGETRYLVTKPACHVNVFRNEQLAESAIFFGTEPAAAWLKETLGEFRPDKLKPQPGVPPEVAVSTLRASLSQSRLDGLL